MFASRHFQTPGNVARTRRQSTAIETRNAGLRRCSSRLVLQRRQHLRGELAFNPMWRIGLECQRLEAVRILQQTPEVTDLLAKFLVRLAEGWNVSAGGCDKRSVDTRTFCQIVIKVAGHHHGSD